MTGDPSSPEPRIDFHPAIPILNVQNLAASVDYYMKALGFQVDWVDPGIIAGVSRGACSLLLVQGDQGHPGTWVWIGVGDADLLYDEVRARGARVRLPPTNYAWANELHVFDLDGHVLRFASDPKKDRPLGHWRDMHGNVWERRPGGGRRRVGE